MSMSEARTVEEVKEVFSSRLRALREEIGISQEAFANALGFARATLSYYESGSRVPDIYFLDTVHRVTGCSVEYLMGYSDNMKPSFSRIGAELYLSDKAIDTIMRLPKHVLNHMLEHPRFRELVRIVQILSYHTTGKGGAMLDDDYREYKIFHSSGIIREIGQSLHDITKAEEGPLTDVSILNTDGEYTSFLVDFCDISKEKSELRQSDLVAQALFENEKFKAALSSLREATKMHEKQNKNMQEESKLDQVMRFRLRMESESIDSEEE